MRYKGSTRRIPPIGIPFNELGVLRGHVRKKHDVAAQRRQYHKVLQALAEREKRRQT